MAIEYIYIVNIVIISWCNLYIELSNYSIVGYRLIRVKNIQSGHSIIICKGAI